MNFSKNQVRRFLLAACTCFFLVALATPAFSSLRSMTPTQWRQTSSEMEFTSGSMLDANLVSLRGELVAQGLSSASMMTYGTVLSDDNVVPNSPNTNARGAVGAVLVGNRLVVRGSFSNLTSPMRDYATDPVNPPNTNITSAFHIHQGDSDENGPFQYALDVTTDEMGRSGSAREEFMLTAEQVQALQNGMLYSDIHTAKNRGGELRGTLMPY